MAVGNDASRTLPVSSAAAATSAAFARSSAASTSWAWGSNRSAASVRQKPLLARYSAFEVTVYAMWSGAALLLPFGAGVPGAVLDAGWEPLAAVALLGVGASAVGFNAWAFALTRLPVSTASSALYSVPVVAILVAMVCSARFRRRRRSSAARSRWPAWP